MCDKPKKQAGIEITPEMITAGEDMLSTWDRDYESSSEVLERILIAMFGRQFVAPHKNR